MSEEFQGAALSDGRRVSVVLRGSVADPDGIGVQLLRDDVVIDEVLLPFPNAGLGGGHIVLSSSERFALLSTFSGQSEEGYELFRLDDRITLVARLSYQFGEAASYCFSPDESLLVMALPSSCIEWWSPWDEGEAEPAEEGRSCFNFGLLTVQDTATARISFHELAVTVPAAWQPSRAEYDPDLRPRFFGDRRLGLSMPWGEIELPLPLPERVVLLVES
jgi:hypothetical protein